MRQLFALLLLVLALPCAASDYHPEIYPLRPGLVAPLQLKGNIQVINGQPSTERQIVYKYGVKMWGLMSDVTQVMVDQTKIELGKQAPAVAGPEKTLELKVDTLLSKYSFFTWSSRMQFAVKLGDGTVITKETTHKSGVLIQDLNGCIAEGVMNLLADPQVRAYLEAPGAATAAPAAAAAAAESTTH